MPFGGNGLGQSAQPEFGYIVYGFVECTDMCMHRGHIAYGSCSITTLFHMGNGQPGQEKGSPQHQSHHVIVFFHRKIVD